MTATQPSVDTKMAATKVVLYVTHGPRLLVFLQPAYPKILLQVPGGTVEPDETPEAAAQRELQEETGLTGIAALHLLGVRDYRFDHRGVRNTHTRHFFHVVLWPEYSVQESWSHIEHHSSLGYGPIEFALFWQTFDTAAHELGYGFAELLPALRARFDAKTC
jgi:8-oxo-dGTP pyrophosphatase MutT (NUDIX family)